MRLSTPSSARLRKRAPPDRRIRPSLSPRPINGARPYRRAPSSRSCTPRVPGHSHPPLPAPQDHPSPGDALGGALHGHGHHRRLRHDRLSRHGDAGGTETHRRRRHRPAGHRVSVLRGSSGGVARPRGCRGRFTHDRGVRPAQDALQPDRPGPGLRHRAGVLRRGDRLRFDDLLAAAHGRRHIAPPVSRL